MTILVHIDAYESKGGSHKNSKTQSDIIDAWKRRKKKSWKLHGRYYRFEDR
jgi:hypothetical protein